jgi:predicted metal-dependent hydrolase
MRSEIKKKEVEYHLVRSDRKTLAITIERDGSVTVKAPKKINHTDIERFVADKRIWIHRQFLKKKHLDPTKSKREFVNGQGFLYLGKSYRLKIVDDGQADNTERTECSPVRLWQGYFELLKSETHHAREHFIAWYKKRTREQLKTRIPLYDKRIGIKSEDFRVLDLGHRWASCSRRGIINFNWRVVMAPIWVFDYILVHEMSHFIEKGHTKKFLQIVSRIIPNHEELALWLKENGRDLDL